MAALKQRTVRKGRIYHIKVADVEYRSFIWNVGSKFSGRVEDQPQIALCHGRTLAEVRNQLCAALTARLAPERPTT
jgi:hypothetical protein